MNKNISKDVEEFIALIELAEMTSAGIQGKAPENMLNLVALFQDSQEQEAKKSKEETTT